ncbi:M1 family metallopeptidase [Winogradskyella psychrotolerans]|uniref:M1 family metallopeptidase n=1 Tax=Winogradskyella psychrotolerans TaxID=1344585 RepID=UPI001C065564|nr:M1 family metallopeptidase [Winogradskyella psychrotolerans]MBU2929614.1 M1 family metallopeptidase [Winogradskyella psychrotolerans]
MKKIFIAFCVFISGLCYAQQTDYVDYKKANGLLATVLDSSTVKGKVSYSLDIIKATDSIFLNAVNMTFENVEIRVGESNAQPLDFSYEDHKIYFKYQFKKGESYTVYFDYSVKPKKALYFLKRENEPQVWTQGQGKFTSHWFPSLDDVNDKIIFNLSTVRDPAYTFISNGLNTVDSPLPDGLMKTSYQMQKPMSSYLLALVYGKYNKTTETSKSGIPLEFYYYPEDSLNVESTYRYSKQMFDFLENEIGFPYPWQIYKQVPVHDFLYAGMENTSLTIFSDAFVVDDIGFNDKNYVNVNAHELAHQWFGDLVTAKSGEHHWLQEGFATYYALLAERDVFGDNYFYFKLLESVLELSRQDLTGNGTSLLDPKSSSLTFYQRGAWVLHALRKQVGDVIFKKAVKRYLEKHQFSNVETSDFIKEVENLYGQSLAHFENYWIKNKAFPYEEAFAILKRQSTFINEYAMVDCEAKTSKCAEYLKYYVSDEAKVKVISQMPSLVTSDVFKNSLKVRQAISEHVTKIPEALKDDYESLLDDKSYVTIENALYNLWVNFPLERSKYLSKTRKIIGFNDKNVRMLWIVLNLSTPYYEADNKQELFNELIGFTDEKYNADVRIKAFNYLNLINSCNEACQSNLELAKSHHNWRLVKFAKEFSEKLDKKED